VYVSGVLPVVPDVEAVKRLLTAVFPEILTCATGATGASPKTFPVAALVAVEDPPLFVAVALTWR
jgi:hypothetical protein